MEGQLVAGQWVEVSMEDLPTPVLLNGFVLSLRPSEVLLTFPELLAPPDGLESEARAVVRYSNSLGNFTAFGHIVRVASGPPVTVTFKRLVPLGIDPRRTPVPSPTLPVALHIVKSRVASPFGPEGVPGLVQTLSDTDMLLETSVLLAVGDTLRLGLGAQLASTVVLGRVIRVSESDGKMRGQFRVGIELVFETDHEREHWTDLAHRWRQGFLR
jgi:hypothetical protein